MYGSHASGTYDRKSDIDILVISQQRKLNLDEIKKLEKKIGREIKIHSFSIGDWMRLKRRSDNFVMSVLKNHILLCGAEI